MTQPTSFESRCACGDVRYRLTSAPLIVHCRHRKWCQRETGTAFALDATIESGRLEVLAGTVGVVQTSSESGVGDESSRCTGCKVAPWSKYGGGLRRREALRTKPDA